MTRQSRVDKPWSRRMPAAPREGARRRSGRWASVIECACLIALVASGTAQEPPLIATATLPESNEARLISNRVVEALEVGDHRLAIRLIEQLAEMPDQLTPASGSRTYYPVWLEAFRLQSRLPEEARTFYRGLNDPEVNGRFARAVAAHDLPELELLFRTQRAASAWPEIALTLSGLLIDDGEMGAAAAILQTLADNTTIGAEAEALRVIAFAKRGAWGVAGEAFGSLTRTLDASPLPGWDVRRDQLAGWLERERARQRAGIEPLALELRNTSWSAALPSDDVTLDRDARLMEAIDLKRRLPLLAPLRVGDALLVRVRGRIYCLDAGALTLRWVAQERSARTDPTMLPTDERDGRRSISEDAGLLLNHALRHAMAASGPYVYTIEDLTLTDHEPDQYGWGIRIPKIRPNRLVARDLRTGEVVWELGSATFEAAFQDRPVIIANQLVIPIQRGDAIALAVLDAARGALIREVPIVGPPTHFTAQGGRCLIDTDGTNIYVCTGNGVIAAITARDFSWRWALTYASTLTETRGRRFWNRGRMQTHDFGSDRPLLVDDMLVVAPIDSTTILAIDRVRGRLRWPAVERGTHIGLAGAVPGGVLLVGDTVTCVDARDGTTIRWQSTPLEIVGKPLVRGERVYVPLRTGITVLDANNGKVRFDSDPWRDARTDGVWARAWDGLASGYAGMALCTDDLAVYSVSPNGITKHIDLQRAAPVFERRVAQNDRPEDHVALAWTRTLSNQHEAALQLVEEFSTTNTNLAAARERLLVRVFVGLAGASGTGEQRLAWLRRAQNLSLSAETAAQLALLIGETLEESGDVATARAHYVDALKSPNDVLMETPTGDRLRQAVWLQIVDRLGTLAPSGTDDRHDWLARVVADSATPDVRFLRRLRVLAARSHHEDVIDRALLRTAIPFELLALDWPLERVTRSLPTLDDESLLALWTAQIAVEDDEVGTLLDARWNARQAESNSIAQRAEVGDPLQMIRLNQAKRDAERMEPFSQEIPFREYRLANHELVADWRGSDGRATSFFIAHDYAANALELVSFRTGQTWRRFPLKTGNAARGTATRNLMRAIGPQRILRGPTAQHLASVGRLAIVSVGDQLTCIGTAGFGGEQRAGMALWQRPMPEAQGNRGYPYPWQFSASRVGVFRTTPDGALESLDWLDGSVRWRRTLDGNSPALVHAFDDRVLVQTPGGALLLYDAETGEQLREMTALGATLRNAFHCGDVVVAHTEQQLVGLDRATLETLWTRSGPGGDLQLVGGVSDQIALRSAADRWELIDARSGSTTVTIERKDEGPTVLAMADGVIMMTSGRMDAESFDDNEMRITAYAVDTGEQAWTFETRTPFPILPGQLTGHPRFIPLLVRREHAELGPRGTLLLTLIDRRDGREIGEPVQISREFSGGDEREDLPGVYVTPARILIEWNGIIAAWGTPALSLGF